MLDALTRSKCYNRLGHSWIIGGKCESGSCVDSGWVKEGPMAYVVLISKSTIIVLTKGYQFHMSST